MTALGLRKHASEVQGLNHVHPVSSMSPRPRGVGTL